jgi:hypothetical protein
VSITAEAAAQARGVPPKVLAWVPGVRTPAYLRAAMIPPIGMPLPKALAMESASGWTP